MRRYLWVSLAVLVLDQATKWWAQAALAPYERLAVLPFFNLTLVYNPGAAFSFLSDAGGWQRWLFVVLAVVITLVLVVWLFRLGRREQVVAVGLALVIGGALGNLVDRLWLGHVVDFLDFHWAGYHWPAFNIADSAITVGVACLLWDGFFGQGRQSEDRSARL